MDIIKDLNIQFNWIDILALVLVLRGIYLGLKNGLVKELFNFISALLSLVIAVYFYNQAVEFILSKINISPWIIEFSLFLYIVLMVRLIFYFTIGILVKLLKIQFAPGLEKTGGAILGFGRGIVVAGIVILCLSLIPKDYLTESIYDKSFSGVFLIKVSERTCKSLTFWLPEYEAQESIFTIPTSKAGAKNN